MDKICQINHIDSMAQQQELTAKIQSKIISLIKLIIYVLKKGFINSLEQLIKHVETRNFISATKNEMTGIKPIQLRPGDHVKVKSKKEIFATLDNNHRYEGCAFMDEMIQYCDTEQIVYKRIDNFFDERMCKFFKAKGIVLLDGITCSGKLSVAGPICNRSCYLFWKEAWLEKIE
jgi:hypothetical protein